MIIKYTKYTESIKNLLVGPTKDEIFKNLGYDRTFDTPEEFIDYIGNNLIKDDKHNGIICWLYKKTNEILFKYEDIDRRFSYNKEKIYDPLTVIFDYKLNINVLLITKICNKLNIKPNRLYIEKSKYLKII